MGVVMCLGEYAMEPFPVECLGSSVSCIEELAYLLKENAYLLDRGIMTDQLASFVEEECALPALGRDLSDMIHRKGSLSAFVTSILEYTGLFAEEEIKAVASVLRQGGQMSGLEKQKMRIDRLVEKQKYDTALLEYAALIDEIRDNMEVEDMSMHAFLGKLWHNKGVTYSYMMVYSQAAACFRKADEEDPRGGYQREYLAAKRLELCDKDFIAFVAENPQYYEASLRLERETAALFEDYADSVTCHEISRMKNLEREGKKNAYYASVHDKVRQMAESYRGAAVND